MRRLTALSLASLAAFSWFAIADPETKNSTAKTGEQIKTKFMELTLTDVSFVEKATLTGETEIALSRLALDRSRAPAIQAFAKRMVEDHTVVASKLQKIVQSKNIAAPQGLDQSHQDEVIHIGKLTGADFDREYIHQMQRDHKAAVELFTAAIDAGKLDPQLREFARNTLPVLRDHQHEAHSPL